MALLNQMHKLCAASSCHGADEEYCRW